MPKNGILLCSLFVLTQLNIPQIGCAQAALRRVAAPTARTLFTRAGQQTNNSSYNQHTQSTSRWQQRLRRLATAGLCVGAVAWQKETLAEKFNAHGVKYLPENIIGPLIALGCTEVVVDTKADRTALYTAAMDGEEQIVAILILHKAHLDRKDAFGTTPLFGALAAGHVKIAKILIAAGADTTNLRTKDGGATPLHLAVMQKEVDIKKLRKLFAWQKKRNYREMSINAQDVDGDTPLMLATARACIEEGEEKEKWAAIVKLFLKHGANPFLKNHRNKCAYDIASSSDEKLVDMFTQIREKQAELEAASGSEVFTSLHEAAARGSEQAARALVEKGYCLDATQEMGVTALYIALFNGHISVAEILINGGAKKMNAPVANLTVLHILATDPRVNAALEKILEWQQKREWKEMSPNSVATDGVTPVFMAAMAGNIQAIDVLHRYGADLAHKDAEGKTAYEYAIRTAHFHAAAFVTSLIKEQQNKEDAHLADTETPGSEDEESLS